MKPEIFSYTDLKQPRKNMGNKIKSALHETGIVGIRGVPGFFERSEDYIQAARAFSRLSADIKLQYAPNRDAGETDGYEIGAEQFKDQHGQWQKDDNKASYYASVPDGPLNKWPEEVDLRTPYLALGELIFLAGKQVLHAIGLNDEMGIHPDHLMGCGRMLHYQKDSDTHTTHPHWCGAHFDHGVFTGLIPAWYFQAGEEIQEPAEAGLFVVPTRGKDFEKVHAEDKSILFFQAGEFGQLASNDRIRATRHQVRKADKNIERFTFALFYCAGDNTVIKSSSELTADKRYSENMSPDGSICYGRWNKASLSRYRAG